MERVLEAPAFRARGVHAAARDLSADEIGEALRVVERFLRNSAEDLLQLGRTGRREGHRNRWRFQHCGGKVGSRGDEFL